MEIALVMEMIQMLVLAEELALFLLVLPYHLPFLMIFFSRASFSGPYFAL
jgi:hypothetical protein